MRPPVGPFRPPPAGRLVVRATRDDAFGAEMLVVVEGLPSPDGMRLTGSLRGPDCSRATTLPVTVPLSPASSPVGVAARAVLTEPAPWTPELPNRYLLEARLEGGDEAWRQPFGGWVALRRLGRRGRSFRLDGRRFVLRAGPTVAIADAAALFALARERHHAVLIDTDDPEQGGGDQFESLLDAADREGVFVVVSFSAGQAESVARCTAFHPSAAFVIARDHEAADAFASLRTPTGPLLGLSVDGGSAPLGDTGPADFLVVRLPRGGLPDAAWIVHPPALPLVACRSAEPAPTSDSADTAGGSAISCDGLQSTLARWGVNCAGPVLPWDWAGYLILISDAKSG